MQVNKRLKVFNICMCIIMIAGVAMTSIFLYTDLIKSDNDAEASTVYKQGSTGTMVETIQTKLKNWGYYTGNVDGIFGSKTTAAVKYFQETNGLTVDGIVGTNTAAAMGITLSSSTTSSSNDVTLLARLVYAESRGEPYTGQVAVASVVLNRIDSSSFPNTMSGVIYQSNAFTVVSDGQINLTPNDTALRAAQDAMNGWDPTNGCLYYYNPDTATNAWIRSKTIMLQIGDHVFCL
jgi:N-acetylmuramoyl-L-alanine amidase